MTIYAPLIDPSVIIGGRVSVVYAETTRATSANATTAARDDEKKAQKTKDPLRGPPGSLDCVELGGTDAKALPLSPFTEL